MEFIPQQTGRMITICKVCCCFVAVAICALSYLMRIPDQVRSINIPNEFVIYLHPIYDKGVAIAICCSLIGFFALGVYPLGLELIVECTYPVDQVLIIYFYLFAKRYETSVYNIFLSTGLGICSRTWVGLT